MAKGEREESDAPGGLELPEAMRDVLASIRALVSAETAARKEAGPDRVLMLTSEMRVNAEDAEGDLLSDGLDEGVPPQAAPILDEESLRSVVNAIVREELQGELGERITRNLRKLIRREIALMLNERDKA